MLGHVLIDALLVVFALLGIELFDFLLLGHLVVLEEFGLLLHSLTVDDALLLLEV